MSSLFIVLLSFSSSLETKCLFLNDEICLVRPTVIDLNPVESKYYPFMITLNKCTGSCKVLSPKIYVLKETKDMNVKAFNMITNENEAKAMTEHISCDCKCEFNSTIGNSNQKWNNVNVKVIVRAQKIIVGIVAHVFLRIVSVQKVLLIIQGQSVMKLQLLWI